MTPNQAKYKEMAARAAVELLQPGMVVGLGHGSTVHFALHALGEKLANRSLGNISAIACSSQTEALAKKLCIPLGDFNQHPSIDLTIDGADEVDPEFNLIKGRGGALLREKLVAQASQREVIIVDESKLSAVLGTNFPLPLEVAPFGWRGHLDFLSGLGGKAKLRTLEDGSPALSDQGNYLLDCDFGPIADAPSLARKLEARAGILEHGLFLGLATDVLVGGAGGVKHHRVAA